MARCLEIALLLIWLTTTARTQDGVYDELQNGKQIAMELTISGSTWTNKNPDWFVGTSFTAHVEYGTLVKSTSGDTLHLILQGVDGIVAYNDQYALLIKDGNDWIAWHYDQSNSGYRFVFLRSLPIAPTLLTPIRIFSTFRYE